MKVNFDAVFCKKDLTSCFGILLRDNKGIVLALKITYHERISSPFVVEAVASMVAFNLVWIQGLQL